MYTADSLARSRLLYNTEIWPEATINERATIHGTYMRLYRDALGIQQHEQQDKRINTQVLHEAGKHDLWMVIWRQRMLYF